MLFLVLFATPARSQEPIFSQFYSAPLYLNPALIGSEHDIYFGANYRDAGDFIGSLTQVSAIYPWLTKGSEAKQLGGFGLSFYNSQSGFNRELKTTGGTVSGSYNLGLSLDGSQRLSFGLQVGFIQKVVDYSSLTFGSQFSNYLGFDREIPSPFATNTDQAVAPVINSGLVWYFAPHRFTDQRRFSTFLGFAAANLNQPNQALTSTGESNTLRTPMVLRWHGAVNYEVIEKLDVSPAFLIINRNDLWFYNLGTYFTYFLNSKDGNPFMPQDVLLGAWYRLDGALVFSFGLKSANLTVGFSYDHNFNSSKFLNSNTNAFELSLAYRILLEKGLKRFSTPLL
ncbi:MAG: PorP/SprF family type IX secretion system membrane protein [Cytophagales bacterium]|nr:PorP/SprF family type IX secretion system membrane protein [Cytophagales bacterium]